MLLDHIEANQLPNIDFEKLVLRFCEELQLPSNQNNIYNLTIIYYY